MRPSLSRSALLSTAPPTPAKIAFSSRNDSLVSIGTLLQPVREV